MHDLPGEYITGSVGPCMPDAPGTLFYTGTTCWRSIDLDNNTAIAYGDCIVDDMTMSTRFFDSRLVEVNDTAFLSTMRDDAGGNSQAVAVVNFASGAPIWRAYSNLTASNNARIASSPSVGYVVTDMDLIVSVSQIVPFDVHTGQAWPPLAGLPLVYGIAVGAGFLFCSVKKDLPTSPDFLVYNITDTMSDTMPVLLHELTLGLQLKLLSVEGNVIAAASSGADGDGVAVLSVDVSGSVQVVANIGVEKTPHGLTLTAGRVYVTSYSAVMWVLTVSDLSDVGFLRTVLLLHASSSFTICGDVAYVKNGGFGGAVEVISLWDDTAAPTPVPQTAAPQTLVPQTASPPTPVPQTTAPQTLVPQTASPPAPVPQTTAPQTLVPQTASPPTPVPQTTAPQTLVPQTASPPAPVPQTTAPQTLVPQTASPPTPVPQTTAPQTLVPQTASPPAPVPQTTAPQTPVPQTASPPHTAFDSLVTVATNHTVEVVPGGHSNLVSCVVPDVLFYVEAGCWKGVNLTSQGVTTYSCGTDVAGEAHRVNDTAVVFLRAGGVRVVDFGSGVRETSFAATAVDVAIGGDSLGYLVSGTQHIDVVPFDARSGTLYPPLTPRDAGAPLSTAAYGNLLFVSIAQVNAAAADLLIYDTTNRTHPSLLRELVIGVQMSAMAASATRIVGISADNTNTLNVLEVHTDGVRWLAAFQINGALSNLALSGSVVYFTSGALLYEVDTSEPDDVRISRALSLLSEAATLSVCDETVYVATEAGLEVVARWVATGVPSAHTTPASASTALPTSDSTALPASASTAPTPTGDSTAATHTTYTVLYVLGGVAGGMVIASVLMCLASRGLRRTEPSVTFSETTEPLSNPLYPVSGPTLYVEAEELTGKEVAGENVRSLLF